MFKNFFSYLKNPIATENVESFTIKIYFKLILLSYFLMFVSSVFLMILKSYNLLPNYYKPEINSLSIFWIAVILAPLFEEILCRLILKISKLNIALFLAILIAVITKILFFKGIILYVYLSAIPLFGLIYFAISQFHFPLEVIDQFIKSKFRIIFHFSAIAFGMLHLSNYETIYWWMIVFIPFLTAPYIALGYVFGYVRMKYGFLYGLAMHSTINFIFAFMVMPKHWF